MPNQPAAGSRRLTLRLPGDLYDLLAARAREAGVEVSTMARLILANDLTQPECRKEHAADV
jgi:hypothetical protein